MTWASAKTPSSIARGGSAASGKGPRPREGLVSLPLRTRCARLAETQEVLVRFQKVGRNGPGTARRVRAVASRLELVLAHLSQAVSQGHFSRY